MSPGVEEAFARVERLEQHRDALLRSLDEARAELNAERKRADKATRRLHALDPDHEALEAIDFSVAQRVRLFFHRNLFPILMLAIIVFFMTMIGLIGAGRQPLPPALPQPPTYTVPPGLH